jgi:hypothetical protein
MWYHFTERKPKKKIQEILYSRYSKCIILYVVIIFSLRLKSSKIYKTPSAYMYNTSYKHSYVHGPLKNGRIFLEPVDCLATEMTVHDA